MCCLFIFFRFSPLAAVVLEERAVRLSFSFSHSFVASSLSLLFESPLAPRWERFSRPFLFSPRAVECEREKGPRERQRNQASEKGKKQHRRPEFFLSGIAFSFSFFFSPSRLLLLDHVFPASRRSHGYVSSLLTLDRSVRTLLNKGQKEIQKKERESLICRGDFFFLFSLFLSPASFSTMSPSPPPAASSPHPGAAQLPRPPFPARDHEDEHHEEQEEQKIVETDPTGRYSRVSFFRRKKKTKNRDRRQREKQAALTAKEETTTTKTHSHVFSFFSFVFPSFSFFPS